MENWRRAYREAPGIVDAFASAEDPDGLLIRRTLELARLDEREVLELGCGTGRYSACWSPPARRYVALERAPGMLALAHRRLAAARNGPLFLCADARQLPFVDGSFDRILAGWVVAHLPAAARRRLLHEADRVLRPARGNGIWLVENGDSGQFCELRRERGEREQRRIRRLVDESGFRVVDSVRTELRFPTEQEAMRILGYLCGDAVRSRLQRQPAKRISHHVVILHRPAEPGTS